MENLDLTAEQLSEIKKYQREFEEKFNKKLYISWPEMKGITINKVISDPEGKYTFSSLEDLLEQCTERYGASLEKIKSREKRMHLGEYINERNALQDYCRLVVTNRLNARLAARLINRDRSVIYHFAKCKNKNEATV